MPLKILQEFRISIRNFSRSFSGMSAEVFPEISTGVFFRDSAWNVKEFSYFSSGNLLEFHLRFLLNFIHGFSPESPSRCFARGYSTLAWDLAEITNGPLRISFLDALWQLIKHPKHSGTLAKGLVGFLLQFSHGSFLISSKDFSRISSRKLF